MSVLKTTLRDLRKSKGLQQADLAALVGVRQRNNWKSRKWKIQSITKISYGYRKGIYKTVEEIFFFEMTKNNTSVQLLKK